MQAQAAEVSGVGASGPEMPNALWATLRRSVTGLA